MPVRKLLAIALLAGFLGSTAACADVTGPDANACPVSGGGQTCDPG